MSRFTCRYFGARYCPTAELYFWRSVQRETSLAFVSHRLSTSCLNDASMTSQIISLHHKLTNCSIFHTSATDTKPVRVFIYNVRMCHIDWLTECSLFIQIVFGLCLPGEEKALRLRMPKTHVLLKHVLRLLKYKTSQRPKYKEKNCGQRIHKCAVLKVSAGLKAGSGSQPANQQTEEKGQSQVRQVKHTLTDIMYHKNYFTHNILAKV